jgi:type III restriction enzyme
MSDFSLMDAIECGIVKLPRVPVADNIPGAECPCSATSGSTSASACPRKGAGKAARSIPARPAAELQTALEALYGHYEKTYDLWSQAGIRCRPASSSSATTPPPPSWSTTTSPVFQRTRTTAQHWTPGR